MDTIDLSPAQMKETLTFLGHTNKYFGGLRAILRHMDIFSKTWGPNQLIRILDVGTGGAEIPIAIAKWGRAKGFKIHITAIDLVSEIADIATRNTQPYPEIEIGEKDFMKLEEQGSPFDYVIASLLLHHISESEQIGFLQKADRLAQRGLIISDLKRSVPSYGAVWALSNLIGNKIVRHDGPLSVQRALTSQELSALAKTAGLPYLRTFNEAWFRASLAGEKV